MLVLLYIHTKKQAESENIMDLRTGMTLEWTANNKVVANILFYTEDGVIAEANDNRLSGVKSTDKLISGYRPSHDVNSIDEIESIRRARKIQFTRNDVFSIKSTSSAQKVDLYIPAELFNVLPEIERLANSDESYDYYGKFFNATFTENGVTNTFEIMQRHYTKTVKRTFSASTSELHKLLLDKLDIKEKDLSLAKVNRLLESSTKESLINILENAF